MRDHIPRRDSLMTKSTIALVVLAATSFLLAITVHAQTDTQQPAPPPAPARLVVGRYQLVPVEHYLGGININEKSVLRIDTATGIVDEWMTGTDRNGNAVDRWVRTGSSH
jgi:hypothetical protein